MSSAFSFFLLPPQFTAELAFGADSRLSAGQRRPGPRMFSVAGGSAKLGFAPEACTLCVLFVRSHCCMFYY